MIKKNVNVSIRDRKNRSPLFYASRKGDNESLTLLTAAGAKPNDGSLHEAAREVHGETVSFLLANGHDPDTPCELHEGRSALAELCLKSEPNGRDWRTRVETVVQTLLDYPTDLTLKTAEGKSILHLALDNGSSLELTRILLQIPQIWKRINDEIFLYKDSLGVCYSPTKYVEHFYEGSSAGRDALIDLLKSKRCEDRHFSMRVDQQPVKAIGLPPEIASFVARQALVDREHQLTLQRRRESAMLEMELGQMQHQRMLEQSASRTLATLDEGRQIESRELESIQRRHTLALTHQQQIQQDRLSAINEQNRIQLQNERDAAVQRRRITDADQTAEANHRRNVASIEQQSADATANIQLRLLRSQEEVASRQHDRSLALIGRQDESVRLKARELAQVAEAQRRVQSTSQLRLENVSEWGSVD